MILPDYFKQKKSNLIKDTADHSGFDTVFEMNNFLFNGKGEFP